MVVANSQMLIRILDLTPLAGTIARSSPAQAAFAVFVQPREPSLAT